MKRGEVKRQSTPVSIPHTLRVINTAQVQDDDVIGLEPLGGVDRPGRQGLSR